MFFKQNIESEKNISGASWENINKKKRKTILICTILSISILTTSSCNFAEITAFPSISDSSSPSSSSTAISEDGESSSTESESEVSSTPVPTLTPTPSIAPTATPTMAIPDKYKYINVEIANFRTTPGIDAGSTIIKQLHYRARVKELSKTDKWSLIVTDTDETGYVFSEYLSDTMPAVTPAVPAGRIFTKWAAESSLPKSYYSVNLADFAGRSIDYKPLEGITVIIDPGHGGVDPGATYNNTVLEKTINLSVSLELKTKLEEMGAEVFCTRTDDRFLSLYYRNALINKYILEKHKQVLAAAGEDVADTDRIIGLLDQVMSKNSDVVSSGGRGVFLGLGVNADIRTAMDISSEYDNIILLSIHCNSIFNADYAHGVEIYYGTNNAIFQDEKRLLVDESLSNPVNPEYQYYDDSARQKFATALRDGVRNGTGMSMRGPGDGLYAWNFCMLRENNLTSALIELGFLSNKGDREYLMDPGNQKIMAFSIAKSIYNYFCAS